MSFLREAYLRHCTQRFDDLFTVERLCLPIVSLVSLVHCIGQPEPEQ